MAGEDAQSAAMHQPINDLEETFGMRLSFNQAFSEVLFLGITYQHGQFMLFVLLIYSNVSLVS